MNKVSLFFCSVFCMIALTQCGKDLPENAQAEENESLAATVVSFKYKGQVYTYTVDPVTERAVGDEEVIQILEHLKTCTSLATLVRGDQFYEYFDSYDDLTHSLINGVEPDESQPPAIIRNNASNDRYMYKAILYMYADTEYRGARLDRTIWVVPINGRVREEVCNNLNSCENNWNNKISSLELHLYGYNRHWPEVVVASFFEDIYCGGKSIHYTVCFRSTVDSARRLTDEIVFNTNYSWNDRIKSFKFTFLDIL